MCMTSTGQPDGPDDPDGTRDDAAAERRIAEASAAVGVSSRVLRYWEQLGVVRPSRGPHGRRHFTRHDLLLMTLIRSLLEDEAASIGDLRLLRETAEREVAAAASDPLLRLQLLFKRQASEALFHGLMAQQVPPPGSAGVGGPPAGAGGAPGGRHRPPRRPPNGPPPG